MNKDEPFVKRPDHMTNAAHLLFMTGLYTVDEVLAIIEKMKYEKKEKARLGIHEYHDRMSLHNLAKKMAGEKFKWPIIFEKVGDHLRDDLRSIASKNISNKNKNKDNQAYLSTLPQQTDIEFAESQLRKSSDEVISKEAVFDQVEENFSKAGKLLKPNWQEITIRNIEIWFGKNK